MIRAAFSVWDNRIAPVFDVARQLLLVEAKSGQVISETKETLPDDFPLRKALCLAELGVNILICGAISRPLQDMIGTYGIRLIPFVAGELGEVKCAWLAGGGDIRRFAMPGCCGRRRQRGSNSLETQMEEQAMRGRKRGGMDRGIGMGRGAQVKGRSGPFVAGPGGDCVCTGCGHVEPHERGFPCLQKQCPRCGAAMVRE